MDDWFMYWYGDRVVDGDVDTALIDLINQPVETPST